MYKFCERIFIIFIIVNCLVCFGFTAVEKMQKKTDACLRCNYYDQDMNQTKEDQHVSIG